jgi:hypothetical protein
MADTFGPQPLEEVMRRLNLTAAQLVEASTEQLSFKMVQKGRKGRRLTPNVQKKILNALSKAAAKVSDPPTEARTAPPLTLKDLFNYT